MAGMRLTGISSGMDTDTSVKELTKAQTLRIDKVKRDKQLVLWKQEMYRGVTDKIKAFTSGYFDVLKGATNFTSPTAFAKFSYSAKINSVDTTKVSISANGDIKNFNHTINSISQLATKDTWTGDTSEIKGISTSGFSLPDLKTAIGTADFKMTVSIDGTAKNITIANAEVQAMATVDDLKTKLNTLISTSFGADYSNVVSKVNVNGNDELKFDMNANVIKLLAYSGSESTMTGLKLTSGVGNYDYATKKLSQLKDFTGVDFTQITINGVSGFGITADDTTTTMMNKINGSSAGVKVSYIATQDKFVMESNKEGSANNITIGNATTTTFLSKFGINDNAGHVSAKNALLNLDGTDIVQSSNNFTFEGVTYTLKETLALAAGPIKISVSKDTQGIFDNIVKFVNEYNGVLGEINSKVADKKERSYVPLTDEEKKAMTEDQVKIWEEKAKKGLLYNDSDLDNMANRMRSAIYDAVKDAGITMKEIGISSSTDYKQKGILIIDQDKLKSAIENRYEDMVKLFTNQSDKDYLSVPDVTERYQENGVAKRLQDIFNDATRTFRDASAKKGFLLEKAGLVGDSTQFKNTLQTSLTEYDNRIEKLLKDLSSKQEAYYAMFAKMESAMSKMQSQSSWLSQQMGGN